MSKVLMLDTTKEPLHPVHPGRARLLLKEGKAAVYRRYPFTLILKTKVDAPAASTLRLKIDPGAKTSGLTKYNRESRNLPKTHWLDAVCVGQSTPEHLETSQVTPLLIGATGHGHRQMCGVNEHGFPIRHRQRTKVHFGYQKGARHAAPATQSA